MLKNLVSALIFFQVMLIASVVFADTAVKATVADLAWMTGSWTGPIGEQTLEENWIRPMGGSIAAVVRFTQDGATNMTELIVIEESHGTLVFRVQQWFPGYVPRNPEPHEMALVELAENRVGFAATGAGDFKTLTYSRPSADSFNIDVETKEGVKFQINLRAQ
ncbi:MAG: DUF6265 family protein [Gammaproteobacteria bacterium]|nr:DUF6265 family protein [Gammaproteobacteria bacterium]